ncbi:MAG: ATP-binding protein [Pseudomonadota bacterium]
MRRITMKLAMFFISLMVLSSVISMLVSSIFPNSSVKKELMQGEHSVAESALELGRKTDLSNEEIAQISSSFMFRVRVVNNAAELQVSDSELKRINNNEIVFLSDNAFWAQNKFLNATTVLLMDGQYIAISLNPKTNIFRIILSRAGLTLFSYILFGAFLIALSGHRAVRPILKLNSAVQEVAKGNFDIQIRNNSNDEVGQLTRNFNKMAQELKRIEYLRKDFINSVSHEFKTPIASIQGFAKLLQKGDLPENEKQEYAGIIAEEAARLSRLSSNILRLSSLENKEIVDSTKLFPLDEQIRKTILLLEHEWSRKNISFDIELEKLQYRGDEELLQQVWINLINNAIKFSPENGNISIRHEKASEGVKIAISDEGVGMSEETMQRIFEMFYQGDKAHSSEGNGLGLTIAKRILDLCGGSIQVDSRLGEGSTFTVILPETEIK